MFALTPPTVSFPEPEAAAAPRANAEMNDRASIGSPSAVPVPCASSRFSETRNAAAANTA